MPYRKTTARRRHPTGDLTGPRVEVMFFGSLRGIPAPPDDLRFFNEVGCCRDVGQCRRFWRKHRKQLLSWWLNGVPAEFSRHFGFDGGDTMPHPGFRPWAWHEFDEPKHSCACRKASETARDAVKAAHLKRDGGVYREYNITWRAADAAYEAAETVYLREHHLLTLREEMALGAEKLAKGGEAGFAS